MSKSDLIKALRRLVEADARLAENRNEKTVIEQARAVNEVISVVGKSTISLEELDYICDGSYEIYRRD